MGGSVHGQPSGLCNAEKREPKLYKSIFAKSVLILNNSPSYESLAKRSRDNLLLLNIGVALWNNSGDHFVHQRSYNTRRAVKIIRQREMKVISQGKRLHVSLNMEANIPRRGVPSVYDFYARLKTQRFSLWNHVKKDDSEIGPAVYLSDKPLLISNLPINSAHYIRGVGTTGHGVGDLLHGLGGLCALRQRGLNIAALLAGNLFHLIDGFFEALSLNPEHTGLNYSDKSNSKRNPKHPLIRRAITRLVFTVGGFIVGLHGRGTAHDRAFLASAMIFVGSLFSIAGWLLLRTIPLRWTWGW